MKKVLDLINVLIFELIMFWWWHIPYNVIPYNFNFISWTDLFGSNLDVNSYGRNYWLYIKYDCTLFTKSSWKLIWTLIWKDDGAFFMLSISVIRGQFDCVCGCSLPDPMTRYHIRIQQWLQRIALPTN